MNTLSHKRKKKTRSPLRRFGRGFYHFIVILSALIVGAFAVYQFSTRKPSTAERPPTPGSAVVTDNPDTEVDESQQGPQLQRKDATWTFLLCAEDQVSGNTDTIMVCTYDTVNQKVGLVSIPRDTLVDRPGWKYHRINAAYPSGNVVYPPDGGINELMTAVGEVLGIPIDHYVIVDTRIFVEVVDEVGGVDFNVPVRMSYDDPLQDLHIHFEPGMQHLTGKQALQVVRCRKNSDGPDGGIYDAYPDADIGRTRTQQEMVKTIAKKVLSKPQKVGDYAEIFSHYVKTDLSLGNLLWFVEPALQFDFANLTTATLPGNGNARYEGSTSLYELDIEGSLAIINDCLNPYTTPVTEDMVRMIQGE